MGAKPPYPLYYENGVVREEKLCGGHSLCEHALTDKTIAGVACSFDRLLRHIHSGIALRRSSGVKKPAPSLGKIKGIVREESAYLHYEKTKTPVQSQKLHWLFGFRGKKMRLS